MLLIQWNEYEMNEDSVGDSLPESGAPEKLESDTFPWHLPFVYQTAQTAGKAISCNKISSFPSTPETVYSISGCYMHNTPQT